eukprot:365711-Chlamydomonas_euryale.AAC.3
MCGAAGKEGSRGGCGCEPKGAADPRSCKVTARACWSVLVSVLAAWSCFGRNRKACTARTPRSSEPC